MKLASTDKNEIRSILDKLDDAIDIAELAKKAKDSIDASALVADYTSKDLLTPDETSRSFVLKRAPFEEILDRIPIRTFDIKPKFIESYSRDELNRLRGELHTFLLDYAVDFRTPNAEHHTSQIYLATVSQGDIIAFFGLYKAVKSALKLADLTDYFTQDAPLQTPSTPRHLRYQYILDKLIYPTININSLTPTDLERARTVVIRFIKATHERQSFTMDSLTGLYVPDKESLELRQALEETFGTLNDFQIEDYWNHMIPGTFDGLYNALTSTSGQVKQQILTSVKSAHKQRLISNTQLEILLKL